MLIMSVRYLCNRNGKRKTESNFIIIEDKNAVVTEEMQLAKVKEMGIDVIKILNSRPKADVLGVSYDETTRK